MSRCYIEREPGQLEELDFLEWGRMLESGEGRHVGKDKIEGYYVSTVWIGLDHQYGSGPPLIYETMIQDPTGAWLDFQERYTYRADAAAGHEVATRFVRALIEARANR